MEVILGIPGKWEEHGEFVERMNATKSLYIYQNDTIKNKETGKTFEAVFMEYNPVLLNAFDYGGRLELDEVDKAESENFKHTLYILGEVKSEEDAKEIMQAASTVLMAEGMAVKVENSGILHGSGEWLKFTKKMKQVDLFQAFVTIVPHKKFYTSFGMHILGLPEAAIELKKEEDNTYSYNLLRTFLYSIYADKMEVNEKNTFALYENEPTFNLKKCKDNRHQQDDLFHNVNGIWELTAVNNK